MNNQRPKLNRTTPTRASIATGAVLTVIIMIGAVYVTRYDSWVAQMLGGFATTMMCGQTVGRVARRKRDRDIAEMVAVWNADPGRSSGEQ